MRRAVEMYVEDPLSEELLRGAFEGKNAIRVEVKEVADEKQLEFVASTEESGEPEPELVGATATGDSEGESGESE